MIWWEQKKLTHLNSLLTPNLEIVSGTLAITFLNQSLSATMENQLKLN